MRFFPALLLVSVCLMACQGHKAASVGGGSSVGPLAKSMPVGSSVDRMTAFAAAKVIAPGAPDFPSGPAISVYFGESLIGCTVSRSVMDQFVGLKEGTPVKITGVVGQHNFLGAWLRPGCTVKRA